MKTRIKKTTLVNGNEIFTAQYLDVSAWKFTKVFLFIVFGILNFLLATDSFLANVKRVFTFWKEIEIGKGFPNNKETAKHKIEIYLEGIEKKNAELRKAYEEANGEKGKSVIKIKYP